MTGSGCRYDQSPMKTRTLLLLSLACGIAILVAGGLALWRLSNAETTPPVALGDVAMVGDMSVIVTDSVEEGRALAVSLEMGGIDDPQPTDGFRLIASGRQLPVADTTCAPATVEVRSCTLSFDLSEIDGVSRVLVYRRGEDQARWVLAS